MDKSLEELEQEIDMIEKQSKKSVEHEAVETSDIVKETESEENIDNTEPKNQTPLPQVVKSDERSIAEFKNAAIQDIVDKLNAGKVDVDEGLKEFVNAIAIVKAVENPKLSDELTKNAADSLKSYTKANTYKDKEKKIERRTKRNEAFYKAFRPILEFDLSHLIGRKTKRVVTKDPQTGKKIVTHEQVEDEPKKTYEDRSYGLCLMMLMIFLLVVPYCVCNIALAFFNGINAVFESFNKFGRTAFWLCTSIAGMAIIGIIIYVILLVIQAAFGVHIFA